MWRFQGLMLLQEPTERKSRTVHSGDYTFLGTALGTIARCMPVRFPYLCWIFVVCEAAALIYVW